MYFALVCCVAKVSSFLLVPGTKLWTTAASLSHVCMRGALSLSTSSAEAGSFWCLHSSQGEIAEVACVSPILSPPFPLTPSCCSRGLTGAGEATSNFCVWVGWSALVGVGPRELKQCWITHWCDQLDTDWGTEEPLLSLEDNPWLGPEADDRAWCALPGGWPCSWNSACPCR